MLIKYCFCTIKALIFLCLFGLLSCGDAAGGGEGRVDFFARKDALDSAEWVAVGNHLFLSEKLSPKEVSCASCHIPEQHFQDAYEVAIIHSDRMIRNTPSLLNVSRYNSFFWDGRASSISEQLEGPLFARSEMNSSPEYLEQCIEDDPKLYAAFQSLRLEGPVAATEFVKYALEKYIRSICTQRTEYHHHLDGTELLGEPEQRGLALFMGKAACVRCHPPPDFTDNQFHDIGLVRRNTIFESYGKNGRGAFRLGPDYGRGNIVGGKEHLFTFRTPSLLNVAHTAPYMHDGTFHQLEEVLDFYARTDSNLLQNPLSLSEKKDLVLFLHSLSDLAY